VHPQPAAVPVSSSSSSSAAAAQPLTASRNAALSEEDMRMIATLPLALMEEEGAPATKRRKVTEQQLPPHSSESSSATPLSGHRRVGSGERYWVAYTDGACPGNGTGSAVAGVGAVLFDPNGKQTVEIAEPLPLSSRQTNQRAEIYAAIRVLELADESVPLEIRTDSNYVVQAMTSWRIGWQRKNWAVQLENKDLFQYLIYICSRRTGPVQWTHVKGHSGEPGNEIADRLAVKGAAMRAPEQFKLKYSIPTGHFTN
jgi:ribonuclease HI